jgi:hypothetical protein
MGRLISTGMVSRRRRRWLWGWRRDSSGGGRKDGRKKGAEFRGLISLKAQAKNRSCSLGFAWRWVDIHSGAGVLAAATPAGNDLQLRECG